MCAMPAAQAVPFRATLCPQCQHYHAEVNRCRAFAVDAPPSSLWAFFSGETDEPCERFEPVAATAKIESQIVDQRVATGTTPATSAAASPIAASRRQVAEITCHKCKALNPTEALRCLSCNAKLLPGEGVGMRIAYLVVAWAMTAICGWVLNGVVEGTITYNLFCFNPIFLAVTGIGAFFWGFYKLVAPTPQFTRYADRASRHMDKNLPQALADINVAIELAPKGEKPGLLKKRQEINTKLGESQAVLRDEIALVTNPETYSTMGTVATMLNLDGDSIASSTAESNRKALIDAGTIKAFGYCKKCAGSVELNEKLKCPKHGGVQAIKYAVATADDERLARRDVMNEIEKLNTAKRRKRASSMVALVLLIAGCAMIIYMINRSSQKAQPSSVAALKAVQPTGAIERSQALVPAVPTAIVPAVPVLFSDHQASFEFPSNWEIIDEAGVQALLRGTLEGIGDWEYIGGVYIGGPDQCPDCAQIVVYMVPLPAEFGGWSDEFYERIKQNAQNSMGSRLELHRQVQLGDFPGWEAIYLGKSGNSKNWDKGFLPAGENLLVMVSGSAHPDQFDLFLPVFEHAYDTLSLYGAQAAGAQVTEQVEAPTQTWEGSVKGSAVNVRSGPGTSFEKLARLAGKSSFSLLGRNAASDWLQIKTPDGVTGWVSTELVEIPIPVDELPVIIDY